MCRRSLSVLLLGAGLAAAGGAALAAPHEHGAARLELIVDGGTLHLHLEVPLDSLLGFERAPRTEAERARTRQAVERLRGADFWQTPAGAACVPQALRLNAPDLAPDLLGEPAGSAVPAAPGDGHAELSARWTYRCANPSALRSLATRAFTGFPRLQRIVAQAVTPAGQKGGRLDRRQPRLDW